MRSRCRDGLEVAFYTALTGFAAFKRHDPHGGGSGRRLAPGEEVTYLGTYIKRLPFLKKARQCGFEG
jgi:hypothetical protein